MRGGLALALLIVASSLSAAPPRPVTPKPGSAERTAILDGLRKDASADIKYRVDTMRVVHSKKGAIAYVIAQPSQNEFDAGTYILTRSGRAPWKMVWADTGGGSDSCAEGARYYRWAIKLIRSYGADPERLVPGIGAQVRSFEKAAKTQPDLQCTGDLEGGPDTVIPAPKPRR
jgi:hypothetical protein